MTTRLRRARGRQTAWAGRILALVHCPAPAYQLQQDICGRVAGLSIEVVMLTLERYFQYNSIPMVPQTAFLGLSSLLNLCVVVVILNRRNSFRPLLAYVPTMSQISELQLDYVHCTGRLFADHFAVILVGGSVITICSFHQCGTKQAIGQQPDHDVPI